MTKTELGQELRRLRKENARLVKQNEMALQLLADMAQREAERRWPSVPLPTYPPMYPQPWQSPYEFTCSNGSKLSFRGGGSVSVDTYDIVRSPKVQAQVDVVRSMMQ